NYEFECSLSTTLQIKLKCSPSIRLPTDSRSRRTNDYAKGVNSDAGTVKTSGRQSGRNKLRRNCCGRWVKYPGPPAIAPHSRTTEHCSAIANRYAITALRVLFKLARGKTETAVPCG